MRLSTLLTLLSVAGAGHALQCYTCQGKREVRGGIIGSQLRDLKNFPYCTEFDPYYFPEGLRRYIQDCPTYADKSCLKIVNPSDSCDVVRTCSPVTKPTRSFDYRNDKCTAQGECYCTENLCNGSGRGWPSAALLLAALVAVLVTAR